MAKPIEARISYYTKKLAEYFSTHVTKKRNKYRLERLANYQRTMHERIEREVFVNEWTKEHIGRLK